MRESACECERVQRPAARPHHGADQRSHHRNAISDPENELANGLPPKDVRTTENWRRRSTSASSDPSGHPTAEGRNRCAFDEIQLRRSSRITNSCGAARRAGGILSGSSREARTAKPAVKQQSSRPQRNRQLAARIKAAKPQQGRTRRRPGEEKKIADSPKPSCKKHKRIWPANSPTGSKQQQDASRMAPAKAFARQPRPTRPSSSPSGSARFAPAVMHNKGRLHAGIPRPSSRTSRDSGSKRLEAIRQAARQGPGPAVKRQLRCHRVCEMSRHRHSEPEEVLPMSKVAKLQNAKADFNQQQLFTSKHAIDGNPRNQGGWAVRCALGAEHWATFEVQEADRRIQRRLDRLQIQIHQSFTTPAIIDPG